MKNIDLQTEVRLGRISPKEAMIMLGQKIKANPENYRKRELPVIPVAKTPKLQKATSERVRYFHN